MRAIPSLRGLFLLASVAGALFLNWLGLSPVLIALLTLLPYLRAQPLLPGPLGGAHPPPSPHGPAFPLGLWGEIYRAVAQYQQRGRKRRKRQIRFVRRFREAAVSVPDALVILDKQRRIEWANPAASVLMNVSWPRDDGKRLTEILQDERIDELIDAGDYTGPRRWLRAQPCPHALPARYPFGERKRQRLVVARDVTKVFHLN